MKPRTRVAVQVSGFAALGLALVCGNAMSKHVSSASDERRAFAMEHSDESRGVSFSADGRSNRIFVVDLPVNAKCPEAFSAIETGSLVEELRSRGFTTISCVAEDSAGNLSIEDRSIPPVAVQNNPNLEFAVTQ